MRQPIKTTQIVRSKIEDQTKLTTSVFSSERTIQQADITLPQGFTLNTRLKMDGLKFLKKLPSNAIAVAFFDPQYRGVLDYLSYGNEGKRRGRARSSLPQMTEVIPEFIRAIDRVLLPSGHLFLWIDKFHLCTGFCDWLKATELKVVDMVTWDKQKIGMGYRTRRTSEYVVILQKAPRKAKGVWKIHTIPDVWQEPIHNHSAVHPKPVKLQGELIEAVSNRGDIIIDPAAGSFSVMAACLNRGRHFLGCDING